MGYDAFISYSHGTDRELAKVVRDGLQKMAKPWNRRRALDVFLDQSSLELSSELGSSLDKRIGDTEWLVLFMSETSAQSKWVGAEISEWAAAKSKDRILLVLTSGEIVWDDEAKEFDFDRSTAVNEGMRGIFGGQVSEPLFLDLRWTKELPEGEASLDLANVKFRDAIATIAASIHGKSKDEIEGDDIRAHKRMVRVRRIAVTALTVLTIAAVVAGAIALIKRAEAIAEAKRASSRALASDASANADIETDLAALLALESVRVANTPDARGSLATMLSLPTRFLQRTDVHHAPLTAIAFGDDGRIAASGDRAGVVRIWDVNEEPFPSPQATPRDTEIELDGSIVELFVIDQAGFEGLIAFDDQGTISEVDLTTGEVSSLAPGVEFVDIAVSLLDGVVAGLTPDGILGAYELDVENDEFRPVNELDVSNLVSGEFETVLAFSPDGTTLALGSGTTLVIWPFADDGEPSLVSLESPVTAVDFGPDEAVERPVVAVGEDAGNVHVYDRLDPDLHQDLDPDLFTAVFDLAFQPGVDESGEFNLASAHSNGDIILWGVLSGDEQTEPFGYEIEVLSGHKDEAHTVAFAPDGRIASGDWEGEVIWWLDVPLPSLGYSLSPTDEPVVITDATIVEPQHVAAVDGDGAAWVWDLEGDDASAISTDGIVEAIDGAADLVALGLDDGTVTLMRSDGTEAQGWQAHDTPVSMVALSSDANRLVSITAATEDPPTSGAFWDATTATIISDLDLPPDFFPMSVLTTDDVVWVGGQSGDDLPIALKIDGGTGEVIGTITHSQRVGNGVTALALTEDGATLATGAMDRKISLWDPDTLERRATDEFNGHRGVVDGIVFWDGDDTMISSDDAGDVLMWDVSEQRLFAGLGGPTKSVNALEADEATGTLVAAGAEGAVWTWTLDPDEWRFRACELAARNMTAAEWNLYGDGGTRVRHCDQYPVEDGDIRDAEYGDALTD